MPAKIKFRTEEWYGVKNPVQNKELVIKCARSGKKSTIKYHWKTNEELWDKKKLTELGIL